MGFYGALLKLGIKALAVTMGAGILTGVAALLILPTLPKPLQTIGRGLVLLCFLAGLAVLVFGKSWRIGHWFLLLGGLVAVMLFALGLILLVPVLAAYHPELLLLLLITGVLLVVRLLNRRFDWLVTLDLVDTGCVGAVEVTSMPQAYLDATTVKPFDESPGRRRPNEEAGLTLPIAELLAALAYARIPCGLRLETWGSRLRLFFTTWAHNPRILDSHLHELLQGLRSFLPQFTFRLHPLLPVPEASHDAPISSAYLHGEPSAHPDPLRAVAEALLQRSEQVRAVVQVFATPHHPAWWTRQIARRRFKRLSRRTSQQKLEPVQLLAALLGQQGQRSFSEIDIGATVEQARRQRQVQRLESKVAVKCRVAVACWGPAQAAQPRARQLLHLLAGAVSRLGEQSAVTVHSFPDWLTRRPFRRLVQGNPTGIPTLLTIDEAAPYFTIPQTDLGIPVSAREEFYTGTDDLSRTEPEESNLAAPKALGRAADSEPSPDEDSLPVPVTQAPAGLRNDAPGPTIELGRLYRKDQLTPRTFGLTLEDVRRHILIVGNTGSGKTCTAQHLAVTLARQGIPFLVLATTKTEWRRPQRLLPDLRIFTVADELTAPFRFNFFAVPPGVAVHTHLSHVITCLQGVWPVDGILATHVAKAVRRTYHNCGWHELTDQRGRPILLPDFYRALLETATEMRYGPEMKQNFEGALQARVETLIDDPVLAVTFNTPHGLAIADLLAHPTVIELDRLSDEHKQFFATLLLATVAEYLSAQGPQPTLSHVLILEEAHRILADAPRVLDHQEGPTIQQKAIDTIVNLLAEARALGLGCVLLDQLPSRLASSAVRMPSTKIVHLLTSADDRHHMARELNCTPRQEQHISAMRRGAALVYVADRGRTVHLQVPNLEAHHPELCQPCPDAFVRDAMAPFYAANPALREQRLPPSVSELRQQFMPTIGAPPAAATRRAPPLPVPSRKPVTSEPVDPRIVRQLVAHARHRQFILAYAEALEHARQGNVESLARCVVTFVQYLTTTPTETLRYSELLVQFLGRRLHRPTDQRWEPHLRAALRTLTITPGARPPCPD